MNDKLQVALSPQSTLGRYKALPNPLEDKLEGKTVVAQYWYND